MLGVRGLAEGSLMPESPVDRLVVDQVQLRDKLLPRLVDSVFHVTSERALPGILAERRIISNRDGLFNVTASERVNPVFLLLRDPANKELIPARAAIGSGDQWIWHVECWYPQALPLEEIDRILAVEVNRGTEDPFIQAHRARGQQRAEHLDS
jgi:hypothetical protein